MNASEQQPLVGNANSQRDEFSSVSYCRHYRKRYWDVACATPPLRKRVSAPAHEHLDDLGVMMVEEEAFACVEPGNFFHVVFAE